MRDGGAEPCPVIAFDAVQHETCKAAIRRDESSGIDVGFPIVSKRYLMSILLALRGFLGDPPRPASAQVAMCRRRFPWRRATPTVERLATGSEVA